LQTIWDLPHYGEARFCYGANPAVIFFRYDRAANKTSIVKKELNGDEHTIAEFPKNRDERSLSCSEDGMTVAALSDEMDDKGAELFIVRGGQISHYRYSQYYPVAIAGIRSLLSSDGRNIALREVPKLVSGPDLLREMRVFVNPEGHNVFFEGNVAYLDQDKMIEKYSYEQHQWKRQTVFVKPPKFGAYEIARCGDRDIATLSDDETVRVRILDQREPSRNDWLERTGVRKILRNYLKPTVVTASYRYCAFPVYGADGVKVEGLVRFDGRKLQRFSFADPNVALANRYVAFSKDGCYALIAMVTWVPPRSQLVYPPQIRLLGASSQQCKP
jgi:hypothetical protein